METDLSNPKKGIVCHRLEELMNHLSNPYKWIDASSKTLYHASAVMMSNHLVTLYNEGQSYMESIGFDAKDIRQMMVPLINGTLENIYKKGTVDGLTGPLVRNDIDTIDGHIQAISHQIGDDSANFYKHMALRTLDMVHPKRIDDTTYNYLKRHLKE